MFFKEFNHFFRDPVPDDSSSGTSDFNKDNEIHEPDDCYCEAKTITDDDLDKIRSKEELNAFYTELKSKLGQDETIQESKMPAKKRNNLDNKDFGLVYKDANGKTIRKYPLNDKAHVASAARLFGHCPDKYKKRLANKILRKAHEFGMDTSGWDTVNKAAKG